MCPAKKPDITLFFLNASRAIRIAFLMEALELPYKLITADRAANGLALAVNVRNSFDWLEGELVAQRDRGSGWLVGDGLTAADVVLQFSVQFIMERKLGVGGRGEGRWKEVEAWLGRTEQDDAYRRAVQKTGYSLDGEFRK